MKRRIVRLLAAASVCATVTAVASTGAAATATTTAAAVVTEATDVRPVMLLLDTSSSMNESDGTGRLKIDGARRALIDFVRGVGATTPVGLRTYPGGSTTDAAGCSQGKQHFAPELNDLSEVDAIIRTLDATGNTPTAAALQQAAVDLSEQQASAGTIVLISDGLSNCGPDPCEVAGSLASSGIDVTVNTVGFRISDEGRRQLECIADKTKGIYADVTENAQLVAQLGQLSQATLDLQLTFPGSVKAAVGGDDEGLVTIDASVTNVGATPVEAAQATLTFTSAVRPVVINPRRRLGNLPPGASSPVQFRFRPPFEGQDVAVDFTVDARARNAVPVTQQGTVNVASKPTLNDAGPLLKNAKRIAVLGDSYSSGEGAGGYEPTTNTLQNGCHRSRATYAIPLWDERRADGYSADLFACSGATTQAIDHVNKDNRTEKAQTDHLRNGKPYDVVLMTMGGNDIGFSDIVKNCVLHPDPCDDNNKDRLAAAKNIRMTLYSAYFSVEAALNNQANMKKRGGRAGALVVLAYPNPMPLRSQLGDCSRAFGLDDQRFFQQLVETLNTSARGAAEQLAREGHPVFFVPDTMDAFQPDHTYCSTQPYINRLNTAKNVTSIVGTAAPVARIQASPIYGIRVSGLVPAPAKAAMMHAAQEQVHPNALGYQAETVELLRWSTTAAARRPVVRTAKVIPVITNPSPKFIQVGPSGSSGATILQPAGAVQLQATGLQPGGPTYVYLESDPVPVDTMYPDEQGRGTTTFTVPRTFPPGRHQIVLVSKDDAGKEIRLTHTLQVRHARPWWVLPLLGFGVVTTGGSVALRRRHRAMVSGAGLR